MRLKFEVENRALSQIYYLSFQIELTYSFYTRAGELKKPKLTSHAVHLTNRPQFSMAYTVIDHRNDVIKCSKLKWNHGPQASGFTAKL